MTEQLLEAVPQRLVDIMDNAGAFDPSEVVVPLSAALAALRTSAPSAEPVLYQNRMRPLWLRQELWSDWKECSKDTHERILARPEDGDWLAETRALYASPPSRTSEQAEALRQEIINSPETIDFMAGVPLEAAHQRKRWGADHDAGKSPYDWFWLIGYLSQKAADAHVRGDTDKALHHTISTGAALANWHAAICGKSLSMRPGIDPPAALTPEQSS